MSNADATAPAPAPANRTLTPTSTPGVYRRGGSYVVRYRDPQGRQRQRAARTLAEARRLRSELSADVSRGEYRPDTKLTFAAYAATWIEGYTGRTGRGIRSETLAEYRHDLARAVEHFGRVKLAAVTVPDVKQYARALAAQGLAPATVRRVLAPVKSLFATAVEEGLLRANPTAGLRLAGAAGPAAGEEEVKVLSAEQLARLVAEVPEGPARLFVRVLAASGLRVGEGLGLRWSDVDLGERRVRVRQRVRGGEVGAPKSRRGSREVPVSAALARDLAAHRLASAWSADGDLVFASAVGKAQHASNAYRWFKPAADRAGVAWAGFHTLRHTAASRWLLSGVSIAQVARLLGHADAGFTLRTYISVMPADLPTGEALAAAVGLD